MGLLVEVLHGKQARPAARYCYGMIVPFAHCYNYTLVEHLVEYVAAAGQVEFFAIV